MSVSFRLDVIANQPSTWRALNLFKANDHGSGAAVARSGRTVSRLRVPMFGGASLNRSILMKHLLQVNEEDLFENARPVVTKVIIPLDQNDFKLGAISFFVGERRFGRVVEQVLGSRTEDITKLELLDHLPSLEMVLIKEKFSQFGIKIEIPSNWLDERLQTEARSFMSAQLNPMLRMAFNRDATEEESSRFASDVFFEPQSDLSMGLANALRVPPEEWPEIVFAWKASIYYGFLCGAIEARASAFMDQAREVVIRVSGSGEDPGFLDRLYSKFLECASGVYAAMHEHSPARIQADRIRLLSSGDAKRVREYVYRMRDHLYNVGTAYAQMEHLLTLWEEVTVRQQQPILTPSAVRRLHNATVIVSAMR